MIIVVGDPDIHGLFNGRLYAYMNGYAFREYSPRTLMYVFKKKFYEVYFFDVPVERLMRDYMHNEIYRLGSKRRIIVHDHHGGYVVTDFEVNLYRSCYDMIVSTIPDVDRDVALVVSLLDGDAVYVSHAVALVAGTLEYMIHIGKYMYVVDLLIKNYRDFEKIRREVVGKTGITYLSLVGWVKKNIVSVRDKYVVLRDKSLIPLYLVFSRYMDRGLRRNYAVYMSRDVLTIGSSPEAPLSAYMILYAVYGELGGNARILGRSSYATLVCMDTGKALRLAEKYM